MAQNLKEAYNFHDRAGQGKISYKEMESAIRAVGKMPTNSEIKKLVGDIGKSETDTFSFEDFSSICSKIARDMSNSKDLVKKAFRVFDKDADGFVNVSELRHILTTLGETLTEEEANQLIKEADTEGNGRINYEQFVDRMSEAAS